MTSSVFCVRLLGNVKKQFLINKSHGGRIMATKLGNFYPAEGGMIPLDDLVGNIRRGIIVDEALCSQDFSPFKGGARRVRARQGSGCRASRGKVVSYEDRILEEIRLFANNKPKRIIGVVLILRSVGYRFAEIGPVELCNLVAQMYPNKKISRAETARVLDKIASSELLHRLIWWRSANISLGEAYRLYRR